MSYLSLDIGSKRIGLAMGSLMAQEYGTLHIKKPAISFLDTKIGTSQAIEDIKKIITREHIEKLIIGNPVNSDGSLSVNAQKIHQFIEILKKSSDIEIDLVDETLTSYVAEEMLKEEGLTIKESKARVDQAAAKLILQQYLED